MIPEQIDKHEPEYIQRKGLRYNPLSWIMISALVIFLPIMLYRNGVLDLLWLFLMVAIFLLLLYGIFTSLFTIKIFRDRTELVNVLGKKRVSANREIKYFETDYLWAENEDNSFGWAVC